MIKDDENLFSCQFQEIILPIGRCRAVRGPISPDQDQKMALNRNR